MTIRKANLSDSLEVKTLVSSLSHFYLENSNTPLPQWLLNTLEVAEFEKRFASEEYLNLVYTENDTIVGYIAMKGESHLYHLFVAENHQGKGISRKLWEHVISDSVVTTYTLRSSIYAVPIYKHFGFKESGDVMSKDGIGFQPMEWIR